MSFRKRRIERESPSLGTSYLASYLREFGDFNDITILSAGQSLKANFPKCMHSRIDTINKLLQEVDWNLFWAVYSEPDHLFHRFFDMVVKRDERLPRLLTKIDETYRLVKDFADLLIEVFDHGFGEFRQGIYANAFFERYGLVRRRKDIVCQRQVDEPKARFLLPEALYKYLSAMPSQVERLFLKIYKQLVKADVRVKLNAHVDPKSSKAFAHGFGIYVKMHACYSW